MLLERDRIELENKRLKLEERREERLWEQMKIDRAREAREGKARRRHETKILSMMESVYKVRFNPILIRFNPIKSEIIRHICEQDYLDTKDLEVSDGQIRDGGQMTKSAIWDEDDEMIWEGAAPNLEIKYDAINGQRPCPSCSPFLVAVCCLVAGLLTRLDRFAGFLLTAQFNIDKKLSNKSEIELQIIFMEQLAGAGVVDWAVIDRFNETNLWEETE